MNSVFGLRMKSSSQKTLQPVPTFKQPMKNTLNRQSNHQPKEELMKNHIQMRKSIPSIRNTHHESKNNNMKSMKNKLVCPNRIALVIIAVVTTLILFPTLRAAPTRLGCATPVVEQYGLGHSPSGDTPLRWRAFIPPDGEIHPAIVVIHGGGFNSGDFTNTQTDQDL